MVGSARKRRREGGALGDGVEVEVKPFGYIDFGEEDKGI